MRLGIAHHLGWAVAVTASFDFRVGRQSQALYGTRATLGPPWTKDHRTALAATVVSSVEDDGSLRTPNRR
jgi:hypothetical protein